VIRQTKRIQGIESTPWDGMTAAVRPDRVAQGARRTAGHGMGRDPYASMRRRSGVDDDNRQRAWGQGGGGGPTMT